MLQSREQIGKLDRRITFQSMIVGSDESNADVEAGWEDVATVWASVTDNTGHESLQADQMAAVRSTEFTIRHRTIDEKWRISFDGDLYDIVSVKRPDRNRYLKILAVIGIHYKEVET